MYFEALAMSNAPTLPDARQLTQTKGALSLSHINGPWFPSVRDGAFVIIWGGSNEHFAYLHDFESTSREALIDSCKRSISTLELPDWEG